MIDLVHRDLGQIPLNKIVIDPVLIPESLKVPKILSPNRAKEETCEHYIRFGINPVLWIGKLGTTYYLLADYEDYEALQNAHHQAPSIPVDSIILETKHKQGLYEIAAVLSTGRAAEGDHFKRLLQTHTLLEIGKTKTEIKEILGVRKSSSPLGKQVQRDLRIVKTSSILKMVLGSPDSGSISKNGFESINPGQAQLSYSLANEIIGILGGDQNLIDEFVVQYHKYQKEIEDHHTTPEELTKPIFQRRNYSKRHVLRLASAIAGHDLKHIEAISDERGFYYGYSFDQATGKFKMPEISLNIYSDEKFEIKKFYELTYLLSSLSKSFLAHIARVRPTSHGANLKTKSNPGESFVPIPTNLPKLDDLAYLEMVRKDKMLNYVNRDRILKALGLRCGHLGYEQTDYDSISTWNKSHIEFESWFESDFKDQIFIYFNNTPDNHPKFNYYIAIKKYLVKKSKESHSIFFYEFFNELFSAVFTEIDINDEHRSNRVKNLERMDSKLTISLWQEVEESLQKKGFIKLTREELESVIRERIAINHQGQAETASKILSAVNQLTKNSFVD